MHLSKVIERWDGIFYQLYNSLVFLKYIFLNRSLKKYIKANKAFKNAYEDKRCFIVLNGPSINDHDLSFLENEYVFASNFLYRSNICKVIKPNFYCWLDSKVFKSENSTQIFKEIKQSCPNSKLFMSYKGFDKNQLMHDTYFTYNKHMPNIYSLKTDIDKISSNFSTVALYAICIAIYFGFRYIYILGLDFEPGAFKHFAKLGDSNCDDPRLKKTKDEVFGNYWSYAKSHSEFYKINDVAKKKGISIFNLNKNSCVRAFEFANYEDIFNENK